MDGGKKYSLEKLVKFINNLEQVVKLTTLYNLKQDGTSKQVIGIFCECIQTIIININILQFLQPLIFKLMVLIIN